LYLLRALVVIGSTAPLWAQYAGPAILSRGEAPNAVRSAPVSFRPFVEITGVYDTGLAGVGVVDAQGNLGNAAAEGVEITGGVSGSHRWRRTSIGLDYQGSFRHYTEQTYFDGGDQALNLGLTHQVSRRASFSLRESAGMYSRNFGLIGLQQAVPFDPSTAYIPATDYFDNRTLYLSSQADLTYQRSARLSFNFGGDYFTVHRRSQALYGTTGEAARGDLQYRVGRHTTIGANYLFTRFGFSKGFGDTNIHTASGSYSVRFSRNLEFSGYGGISFVETKFIQSIKLDPIIAAIIGQGTATSVIYRTDIAPNVGGRLSRTFHNGAFSINAATGITPGNGLFLTSKSTSASVGYAYTGLRYWSANANAGYNHNTAISNVNGTYGGYSAGLHLSRSLVRSMHFVASFDVRQYDSADYSRYQRLIYRASVGLGFAPGNIPLRPW
jgi:hypothetical protein